MLTRRLLTATFAVAIAALVGATGCGRGASDAVERTAGDADVLAKRDLRMKAALAQTDSGAPNPTPLARWLLPASLKEVSGLALTADGRLLAHDDSHGRVSEIDYRRGTVVKRFALEPTVDHVDFEGITVADSVVFLLASNGTLYEFAEGADGAHVPYIVHDTELGSECEFEGVAFDRECLIFEVCQPQQAKKVLDENMSVSTALPCRISIYEEGGQTILATLKPTTLLGMFNTPQLAGVAQEVEATIIAIMEDAVSR